MKTARFILNILLSIAAIAVIWIGGGYILMNAAINDLPTRNKPLFLTLEHDEQPDSMKYLRTKYKRLQIRSKIDSVSLNGILLYNPHKSKSTIIICHGITDNNWLTARGHRLDGFLERGYNILIYDQRAHGKSGGRITTFGLREKFDLDQWVDTVAALFPKGNIGVEGISMGAATAILHAGLINPMKKKHQKVQFYIFDSPFSDLGLQLAHVLKVRYRLPDLGFIAMLNFWNKRINNFDIFSISPISAAQHIDVPVLFIHGKDDQYVPPSMSKSVYSVVRSKKMLYFVPQVGHADAIYNSSAFWNVHDAFFNEIVKLKQDGRKKYRENGIERALAKRTLDRR